MIWLLLWLLTSSSVQGFGFTLGFIAAMFAMLFVTSDEVRTFIVDKVTKDNGLKGDQ